MHKTFSGKIHSPNHPDNYDNNQECSYLISQPEGVLIELTIVMFELEDSYYESACYDYVEAS